MSEWNENLTKDLLSLTDGGLNDTPQRQKNAVFMCPTADLNSSSDSNTDNNCGQGEHGCESKFLPESEAGLVKHVERKGHD